MLLSGAIPLPFVTINGFRPLTVRPLTDNSRGSHVRGRSGCGRRRSRRLQVLRDAAARARRHSSARRRVPRELCHRRPHDADRRSGAPDRAAEFTLFHKSFPPCSSAREEPRGADSGCRLCSDPRSRPAVPLPCTMNRVPRPTVRVNWILCQSFQIRGLGSVGGQVRGDLSPRGDSR